MSSWDKKGVWSKVEKGGPVPDRKMPGQKKNPDGFCGLVLLGILGAGALGASTTVSHVWTVASWVA